MNYNHIFAIFEIFQKFHFLDKKLYFEGFRLGFSKWKVNPSILKFTVTESKFLFFEIKLEDQETKVLKFFEFLKMVVLINYSSSKLKLFSSKDSFSF